MKTLTYLHTPEYKAFLVLYLDALKKHLKLVEYDSKDDRIKSDMDLLKKDLATKYKSIKDKVYTDYTARMTMIKKSYKNTKSVYQDPQAEILKRQDFDLEFSMMDIHDVVRLLEDEEKNLSSYELNRIKAKFGNNSKIAMLLAQQHFGKTEAYESDSEYQTLAYELNTLNHYKKYGLEMVYIPVTQIDFVTQEEVTIYKFFDFTFGFKPAHRSALESKIREMTELINNIKNVKPEYPHAKLLGSVKSAQKMEFEEFDERIFNGGEMFDDYCRFRWLKERFNDTTTDRWLPVRDDYDIVRHIKFLENRLAQKIKKDKEYADAYRKALIACTGNGDISKSVFPMARDMF